MKNNIVASSWIMGVTEIYQNAMSLSPTEKADLITALLDSYPDNESLYKDDAIAEAIARDKAIEAGSLEEISESEFFSNYEKYRL